MIKKHLIINNNGNEELILFINFDNEFSIMNKSYKKTILDYIKDNKIMYKGSIVFLAVGSLIIATFNYNKGNISLNDLDNKSISTTYTDYFDKLNTVPEIKSNLLLKEKEVEIKEEKSILKKDAKKIEKEQDVVLKNNTFSSNDITISLYRSNGEVKHLSMSDYLIGVLAAEIPASFNIEALKAQAVISRTYALKCIKNNKKLTDNVSTQSYIDVVSMKKKWGSDFDKYYEKIKNAVNDTARLYITYNGQIIDAVYHSTSNGYTEDSIEVWGNSIPYLKSVESSWDKSASSYERKVSKSESELLNIFGVNELNEFEIIKRDSTGRVSLVKVNDFTYSGIDIRGLLSLRSADFDIEKETSTYIFTTRGYGHGVGLSQYGANGMAKSGFTFDQIIKHYYTNVKIEKY